MEPLFQVALSCYASSFRHFRRVVVTNLPLTVFHYVDKGITGLDLVSGFPQAELINTNIRTPVVTNAYMTFKNLTTWFALNESVKVILNKFVIGTWSVRYSW